MAASTITTQHAAATLSRPKPYEPARAKPRPARLIFLSQTFHILTPITDKVHVLELIQRLTNGESGAKV